MSAIDIIKRRLKEDRIPETPEEVGQKKKRPREVAFMDVNLCFPCGKCPEFCPVQCIEYLSPGSVPGRGVQPVQDRFQECIGCYICVEVCALLTDYDAVRMYDSSLVEDVLGVKITDTPPPERDTGAAVRRIFFGRRTVSPCRQRLAHPREDDGGRARNLRARARARVISARRRIKGRVFRRRGRGRSRAAACDRAWRSSRRLSRNAPNRRR